MFAINHKKCIPIFVSTLPPSPVTCQQDHFAAPGALERELQVQTFQKKSLLKKYSWTELFVGSVTVLSVC